MESDDTMMKFGIGQPLRRFEDPRLLTGKSRFQDDVQLPRQAYAVFVRSPHAHARIRALDTTAAARAPGVLAVFTGADYQNDGLAMPKAAMPRKRADGSPAFAPQRPALVIDRVRYVGDTVAMVIAESLDEARDAAELVAVDYEPLPAVTSVAEAAEPDAPRLWDDNPDNISHTYERGDRRATEAAFARAARIVKRRYVVSRVHAQYIEPRGSLGIYDTAEDRYTLYADVNYPHRVRNMLASMVFSRAGESGAGNRARRRRRVWRQGLAICRSPPRTLGGKKARAAGQMALRALRGLACRRARPRQYRHDRAGV